MNYAADAVLSRTAGSPHPASLGRNDRVDDDWYAGRLKEVPGVFSQGESLEELEENIRDAYQLMMEATERVGRLGPPGCFQGGE